MISAQVAASIQAARHCSAALQVALNEQPESPHPSSFVQALVQGLAAPPPPQPAANIAGMKKYHKEWRICPSGLEGLERDIRA
jgi:hypothetical protein